MTPTAGETLIHSRSYDVKTYRIDGDTMRIRGRVTDTKPAGLFVVDDVEPLDVHDMIVDLVVSYPMFDILAVDVVFDTHPHESCPSISDAYQALVGLSIARGFSRKVTEIFGGPNGCTHVGALLRAMAPVAVQSTYSMMRADPDFDPANPRERTSEERERSNTFVIDSCHVWDAGGEYVQRIASGDDVSVVPVWLRQRLRKLGRPDETPIW